MKSAFSLHQELNKVCPIVSVNTDRVITFLPEATKTQREQAQSIADGWDFDAKTPEELNAPILAEIERLERAQIRPLAECVAAIIAGETLPLYAKAKLADLEKQKGDKRKELVK